MRTSFDAVDLISFAGMIGLYAPDLGALALRFHRALSDRRFALAAHA
jgi:hypothetical protein